MLLNNDYVKRSDVMNAVCSDCYCCATIDEFEDTACPVKKKYMSIPAVDAAPRQKWISVTDNLPKVGGKYWTLRYFEQLPIVQLLKYGIPDGFDNEYFYTHDDEWEEDTVYGGITHWLPLSAIPEPPKKEKK